MWNDLFEQLSQPPITIPGGVNHMKQVRQNPSPPRENADGCGRDYAKKYVELEKKLYMKSYQSLHLADEEEKKKHGALSDLESVTNYTSHGEPVIEDEKKMGIYDAYGFDQKDPASQHLSICGHKTRILDMIEAYKVIIITGATGCGKTTQIPQFILDECKAKRKYCNIIVTQPRRIAAISVAKRVCKERNWKIGSVVGYQIGQQRVANEDTCITYCTTGVLLQRLVADKKAIGDYSHIILDEVHERDSEMDFLLIIIRKLINTHARTVKVILMSATVNTDNFSEYFVTIRDKSNFLAPVVTTSEELNFTVRTYYLNDLIRYIPEASNMIPDDPEINKKGYMTTVRLIQAFDTMDAKEAETLRKKCVKGSVLVFLPGLYEIEELKRFLDDHKTNDKKKFDWWITALHSSITAEEQDMVFCNPPGNCRKVILSTNIAESSITVSDVKYVIDYCLTKVLITDHSTNLSSLQICWASKNNLKQRSGRTGRVMEGRVYRLITEDFYKSMDEEPVPEMLRCPLDQLVLQAKLLDMGSPIAVFALAMDHPDLRNIEQTIMTLKETGALLITMKDLDGENKTGRKFDNHDGELTYLGRTMAKLPMNVRLGKLIYFGNVFGVLDECIVMACAMSVKNLFSSPFQEYVKAYNSKLAWANSTCSDCIAFLNAYTLWRKKRAEGLLRNKDGEIRWGKERFIQIKILQEIATLHQDITRRLEGSHLINVKSKIKLTPVEKNLFLKLAIAGAFYPNYFFRGFQSGQTDEKEAVATLCGHDPYTTVYLQGMPNNQPGVLYKKSIAKHFEQISNHVNVSFNQGSKVFVSFGNSEVEIDGNMVEIPGKIDMAVYRAVKMRQSTKSEIRIPLLRPEDAEKTLFHYKEKYKEEMCQNYAVKFDIPAPWNRNLETYQLEFICVRVSHLETPQKFWAQSGDGSVEDLLCDIEDSLNKPNNLVDSMLPLKMGVIYAAPYRNRYYRCRIVSHRKPEDLYDIYFIDYGNTMKRVTPYEIKIIKINSSTRQYDKLPDLAIQCSLVKIQPPAKDEGKWSSKTIDFFKRTVGRQIFIAKVYSIVNGVVKIKLFPSEDRKRTQKNLSLNQHLINTGMAEEAEESYLSELDHSERTQMQKFIAEGKKSANEMKNISELDQFNIHLNSLDIELPSGKELRHEAILRGPFSPLEMSLISSNKCSISKRITIERSSVNSVLLDTNPLDVHERMVIAAHVTISPSGQKLSLKDTTVMPSLPGLPALICLMFAPMVELRCDPEYTRFTGALCGLGYFKDTKQPIYPDNDMEIVFDIAIDLETILKINKVRYWLNMATEQVGKTEIDPNEMSTCQQKLYEYINVLIWEKWHIQELCYTTESYKWGLIDPDSLLNPISDSTSINHPADDGTSIYRMIWGIDLDGDPSERLRLVKKNNEDLKLLADGIGTVRITNCVLCQVHIPNPASAKLHLKTSQHKARLLRCEKLFEEFEENQRNNYSSE